MAAVLFSMTLAGGMTSLCTGAATGGACIGGLTLMSTLAGGVTSAPLGVVAVAAGPVSTVPGKADGGAIGWVGGGLTFVSMVVGGGVTSVFVGDGMVVGAPLLPGTLVPSAVDASARAAVQQAASTPAAISETLFMTLPFPAPDSPERSRATARRAVSLESSCPVCLILKFPS
jgi:hypothetical protein